MADSNACEKSPTWEADAFGSENGLPDRSAPPREGVFRRVSSSKKYKMDPSPPGGQLPGQFVPDFGMDPRQQQAPSFYHSPLAHTYEYYGGSAAHCPPHITAAASSDSHAGPSQPPSYPDFYHHANNHSHAQTPSFESSGSGGGPVVPPTVVCGPSPMMFFHGMPYGPGFPPYPLHHWAPPSSPPVEYVTTIKPEDVLSGRGGATNSHSGNRAFRRLVKEYQEEYLQAKKRDKPAVASVIVELIRKKGGRFLRRYDTNQQGQVLYIDIGDERAREKTCQALREGAPEIRRRKQASSDESDVKRNDSLKDTTEATLSSASSLERTLSSGGDRGAGKGLKTRLTSEDDSDYEDPNEASGAEGPIMIRPLSRLLPYRAPVEPIPLDKLSQHDRDLYLRDFLPPCPPIRKRQKNQDQSGCNSFSSAVVSV